MSGDLDLEQRYRRVLRLLPGYYRDKWEEDMVAAFLDSWMTGDPDEDSVTMEYDRPTWQEIASVIALAARLYLGGAATPRRYFAWGQAVRLAVLAVVLVHATQGLSLLTLLAWRRHLAGWFPALPASLAGPVPDGAWPTVMNVVDCVWIVIFVALVLGYHRMARVVAALAITADLVFLLQAQFAGLLLRPLGTWSSFFLLDFALVLAMAAFHRDAPPPARRPWLLALPGYYLLVPVPVLVLQATGNLAWLPDSAGLGCLVVSLFCLAHAPRALSRSRRGRRLGRVVAGPDAARRGHRGVADRLARQLRARPAPDQGEPGRTAHPAGRRRAGRPRRRPCPGRRVGTAAVSATGLRRTTNNVVRVPAAPGVRPGRHARRGPRAHRRRLRPPDPARAVRACRRAAAEPSAVTDRPAGHARPASRASRRVPGPVHHDLRAGQPRPVRPPGRYPGNHHLRGGLRGLLIPAEDPLGPGGAGAARVPDHDHPARCRRDRGDSGRHDGL